jgi:hypothetical protein
MYTNSAVAAVVVEIEQNVIKQTRLEIFFQIISVFFHFLARMSSRHDSGHFG